MGAFWATNWMKWDPPGKPDRDQVEFSKPTARQKLGRPPPANPYRREGGGDVQREGVPTVLPTLPGPGGGEIQPLVNAGDAVPALCRAGLGYWAGAGKAPPQVTGGLRNSSPHSAPTEPQLIWEL